MENALLRSLMDKEFYEENDGPRCSSLMFSEDGFKIKQQIDKGHEQYSRSLTPDEVEALFMAANPMMTTAKKAAYMSLFQQLRSTDPLGSDVAADTLKSLSRKAVGERLAEVAFNVVNGDMGLNDVRRVMEEYNDDFTPAVKVVWEDIDFDTIMDANSLETRWKFNIPSLARKVEGINGGQLIEIGARPNTGKTSFHASTVMGPDGFVHQGAKVLALLNEEGYHRVILRYINAVSGMSRERLEEERVLARKLWNKHKGNLLVKDATGKNMDWVHGVCKAYKPDIVVLDMGDKFAKKGSADKREDQTLKDTVIMARQIAKEYDCAVMYMSQLSADAQGKIVLNPSMMEGSKTGKAAEADLMILIATDPPTNDSLENMETGVRHINVVKNKINGWHGVVTAAFDHKTARYTA